MVRVEAQLGPRADAYPLVGEAVSKARAASLVGRDNSWDLYTQALQVLGLIPAHWWREPCPAYFCGYLNYDLLASVSAASLQFQEEWCPT